MKFAVGMLIVTWGVFGYMVYCDPMAICGIFWPLVSTGQALDYMSE